MEEGRKCPRAVRCRDILSKYKNIREKCTFLSRSKPENRIKVVEKSVLFRVVAALNW